MQRFTASDAKQRFGDLLEAAARGPVAIERHKAVRAIVCSPEDFAAHAAQWQGRSVIQAERLAARARQQLIEKDRLIKHQRVALALLQMPESVGHSVIDQAKAVVQRWRAEHLCSADYIEHWERLLALPVPKLAQAMCDEGDAWGAALRQNSPWHVVEVSMSQVAA